MNDKPNCLHIYLLWKDLRFRKGMVRDIPFKIPMTFKRTFDLLKALEDWSHIRCWWKCCPQPLSPWLSHSFCQLSPKNHSFDSACHGGTGWAILCHWHLKICLLSPWAAGAGLIPAHPRARSDQMSSPTLLLPKNLSGPRTFLTLDFWRCRTERHREKSGQMGV